MAKQYSSSQFSTSIGDAPEAEIIAKDIQETENESIAQGLKEHKFNEGTIKKLIENFDSATKVCMSGWMRIWHSMRWRTLSSTFLATV